MPAVDVIDQTYAAVPPRALREVLCAEPAWARVLPDLRLDCFEDRGVRGKRWTVSGGLDGTAEVWLEEVGEGTVVHVFLQADPATVPRSERARAALDRAYRIRLKRWVTGVRDRLDAAREVGMPPAHVERQLRGRAEAEDSAR
ncbi:polyketide cyclase / dehydrase and lipid transport [Mumia zhuanghuii]|uniref:Polyketide cyclase / dehydrase and lipid transport n=1 Tax=Mumia zhuanghuii TaxID=2585211 RepID=A0A5C4MBQ4_9ACTN|nr:polyketide cyclase / dehydrase and lipid transport [Mumia zhuanghuii]TNC33017.1 polyketide cyclase / dehydrase and lipid transport [Mumia zhuanghuii]TNC36074.1 polyketide cyclase / dehydrase and lipid transport [Mumia zhuanghuii]